MSLDDNCTITMPLKTPMLCQTKGDGHWSGNTRTVATSKIEMEVGDIDASLYWCKVFLPVHMKVYFPKKSWDTDKHGLIYTDSLWLKDFRKQFAKQFPSLAWVVKKIDYTEQGMQGDNYVSLEFTLNSLPAMRKFSNGVDRIKNKKIKLNRECMDLPVYVDGVEVK